MKKGFTLVELIGVIVLLGAILLIIVPIVSNDLKQGKNESLNTQIKNIELTMATYNNQPSLNETYYLTLSQLKQAGLVEHDLKNPVTNEYFANDMLLKMTNVDGVINYTVLTDTGSCKYDYNDIPKIENKDVVYVEINSDYSDVLAEAKDKNGILLNNVTSESNVDTSKIGSYYIIYNASKDGKCNKSIKNIIVRDTTAPIISFKTDELIINLSDVNKYDFKSDITVTDNSGITPEVVVETNFKAIKGSYSIKYIATDSSGNSTTKLRKVTLK